jgi:hypothetical protein
MHLRPAPAFQLAASSGAAAPPVKWTCVMLVWRKPLRSWLRARALLAFPVSGTVLLVRGGTGCAPASCFACCCRASRSMLRRFRCLVGWGHPATGCLVSHVRLASARGAAVVRGVARRPAHVANPCRPASHRPRKTVGGGGCVDGYRDKSSPAPPTLGKQFTVRLFARARLCRAGGARARMPPFFSFPC